MNRPETRWVERRGRNIAYQVTGSGETPLLVLELWLSNLDSDWDLPSMARALRHLESGCRLIRYDKSGMGLSDRLPPSPESALEVWADEAIAVLDAAEIERVSVAAFGWSGPLGVAIAGQYRDRVDKLVLHSTFARTMAVSGSPFGLPADLLDAGVQALLDGWGSGVMIDLLGMAATTQERQAQAHYERSAVARGDLGSLAASFVQADAVDELGAITCPTLVSYRVNPLVPVEQSERMVAGLADAEFVELGSPTAWTWPALDEESPVEDCVLSFVTESSTRGPVRTRLLTILFADIEGSTPMAARLGDHEWSDILDTFWHRIETQLAQYEGRLANTAGDGLVATFDSPTNALHFGLNLIASLSDLALRVRVGVHTGECLIVDGDLRGLAVHTAARIMSTASGTELVTSRTVMEITAGADFTFQELGARDLRGVPTAVELFRVDTPLQWRLGLQRGVTVASRSQFGRPQ